METEAAALPVPSGDDAELDDAETLPLVPMAGDESPTKRYRANLDQLAQERRLVPATEPEMPEPTDADAELARLLAKKEMETAPSWALALSNSLTEQVNRIAINTSALQDQIGDVDRRNQQRMAEIVKQSDERAAALQQQLDDMKKDVKALQDRQVNSAQSARPVSKPPGLASPADAAPSAPSFFRPTTPFTRSGGDETDFNHIVLGGWPKDSARRTIEDDSWELLRRMTGHRPEARDLRQKGEHKPCLPATATTVGGKNPLLRTTAEVCEEHHPSRGRTNMAQPFQTAGDQDEE